MKKQLFLWIPLLVFLCALPKTAVRNMLLSMTHGGSRRMTFNNPILLWRIPISTPNRWKVSPILLSKIPKSCDFLGMYS